MAEELRKQIGRSINNVKVYVDGAELEQGSMADLQARVEHL